MDSKAAAANGGKMPDVRSVESSTWATLELHKDSGKHGDDIFTFESTDPCVIEASDSQLKAGLWVTTPKPIDDYVLAHISEITINTAAHMQSWVSDPTAGSWSWFDIALLDKPNATKPKIIDKRSLVWLSHEIPLEGRGTEQNQSTVFDRSHEIFRFLKRGDHLAIRVCARFRGWLNSASQGSIVVRLSDEAHETSGGSPTSDADPAMVQAVRESNLALQKLVQTYLGQVTSGGTQGMSSTVADMLSAETRIDQTKEIAEKLTLRPLKLLSFDGGGIRGVSSLLILKEVMKQLPDAKNKKPCDVFDMICGTSTGGLIAIMLGRLRMDVDECLTAYEQVASEIFGGLVDTYVPNVYGFRWLKRGLERLEKWMKMAFRYYKYSKSALEAAIKKIVKRNTADKNEDTLMLEDPPAEGAHQCKVFVLACESSDIANKKAEHLRTYRTGGVDQSLSDLPIWVAARATSAAPTYFPSMNWGKGKNAKEYLDAGLGFNNPVMMMVSEARNHFGKARPIGCLLSIGTGMAPNVAMPKPSWNPLENIKALWNTQKALIDAFRSGEQAHRLAEHFFEKSTHPNQVENDAYFRFNPGVKKRSGGGKSRTDDWEELIDLGDYRQISKLKKTTMTYLGQAAIRSRLRACAKKLD